MCSIYSMHIFQQLSSLMVAPPFLVLPHSARQFLATAPTHHGRSGLIGFRIEAVWSCNPPVDWSKTRGHIDARGLPGGIPFLEVKTEAEILVTCDELVCILLSFKQKASSVLVSTRCLLFSSVFHLYFSQLFARQ